MLFFINTITDKADWLRKVFDEDIVAKWKLEAMAMDPEDWKKAGIEGGDMTEKMLVNVSTAKEMTNAWSLISKLSVSTNCATKRLYMRSIT